MIRKICLLTLSIFLALSTFACADTKQEPERPFTTSTLSFDEWTAKDSFLLNRYKQKETSAGSSWVTENEADATFETVAKIPDTYRKLNLYVNTKYITTDYRLRAIQFTVTTKNDCVFDFCVNTDMYLFEKYDCTFMADTPTNITFEVNRAMPELFSSTRMNRLAIGKYKLTDIEILGVTSFEEQINNAYYGTTPSLPQLPYCISNVELLIDTFSD